MDRTADELDRLAADLLTLVPRLRAAAKAMRKGAPVAAVVLPKSLSAKGPAKKAQKRKAAKKAAPKKVARKAVRKSAKKAARRGGRGR